MSLSPSDAYPNRFVNSSLAAFVDFLYLVSRERTTFVGQADAVIDAEVASLEEALIEIDRRAFADEDNWWAVIVEQLKAGLL